MIASNSGTWSMTSMIKACDWQRLTRLMIEQTQIKIWAFIKILLRPITNALFIGIMKKYNHSQVSRSKQVNTKNIGLDFENNAP